MIESRHVLHIATAHARACVRAGISRFVFVAEATRFYKGQLTPSELRGVYKVAKSQVRERERA